MTLIKYVSKKESYSTKNATKYFIEYIDNDVIKPICIRLLQMIGYGHFSKLKLAICGICIHLVFSTHKLCILSNRETNLLPWLREEITEKYFESSSQKDVFER